MTYSVEGLQARRQKNRDMRPHTGITRDGLKATGRILHRGDKLTKLRSGNQIYYVTTASLNPVEETKGE